MLSNIKEEYLKILSKNSILIEIDDIGKIKFANRKFLKLKNLEVEDIRNSNIYKILFSNIKEEKLKIIQEKIKNKETWNGDIKDLSTNGNIIYFNVIINPLYENNNFKYFLIFLEDITEKKNVIEIDKKRTNFMAKVSHELRSPINNINAFLEIISETNLDDEQKEYFEIIQNQSHLLLDLVGDILDYAKIESGNMELNLEYEDLENNLKPMINSFSEIAKNKNINYNFLMDKLLYMVEIDKLRVLQIINNLISNALKFTHEEGTIDIRITIEEETEDDYNLKFSVKDTGIGMTKEQLLKVFEEFKQANKKTVSKYGGTGLGLSISLFFVKLMNGKMNVKSIIDKGSEFYFNIKIKKGKKLEKQLEEETQLLDSVSGLKVLIFEHSHINEVLLKQKLKSFKFSILKIINEKLDFFKEIKENKYNLIILDEITINKIGTNQILRKLRFSAKNTPIIILSENKDEIDKDIKNKINYILPKIFTKQEFIESINHVLNIDFKEMHHKIEEEDAVSLILENFKISIKDSLKKLNQNFKNNKYKEMLIIAQSIKESSKILSFYGLIKQSDNLIEQIKNKNFENFEKNIKEIKNLMKLLEDENESYTFKTLINTKFKLDKNN